MNAPLDGWVPWAVTLAMFAWLSITVWRNR